MAQGWLVEDECGFHVTAKLASDPRVVAMDALGGFVEAPCDLPYWESFDAQLQDARTFLGVRVLGSVAQEGQRMAHEHAPPLSLERLLVRVVRGQLLGVEGNRAALTFGVLASPSNVAKDSQEIATKAGGAGRRGALEDAPRLQALQKHLLDEVVEGLPRCSRPSRETPAEKLFVVAREPGALTRIAAGRREDHRPARLDRITGPSTHARSPSRSGHR